MEKYIFWSEIESGIEEPGGTPPPRIPRSTPQGHSTGTSITLAPLYWYADCEDKVTKYNINKENYRNAELSWRKTISTESEIEKYNIAD